MAGATAITLLAVLLRRQRRASAPTPPGCSMSYCKVSNMGQKRQKPETRIVILIDDRESAQKKDFKKQFCIFQLLKIGTLLMAHLWTKSVRNWLTSPSLYLSFSSPAPSPKACQQFTHSQPRPYFFFLYSCFSLLFISLLHPLFFHSEQREAGWRRG